VFPINFFLTTKTTGLFPMKTLKFFSSKAFSYVDARFLAAELPKIESAISRRNEELFPSCFFPLVR
jgi:hypothetical protein